MKFEKKKPWEKSFCLDRKTVYIQYFLDYRNIFSIPMLFHLMSIFASSAISYGSSENS